MARSATVDPLEKFRFQVLWSGEGEDLVRAGFHDIQMPKRSTNKINYRDGIDPDISQLSPGLSSMEDVVMSRGLIADIAGTNVDEFYDWASRVHKPTSGHVSRGGLGARDASQASNTYRKDVTIQQLDREGAIVRQWTLHQCWPTNFVPGSDLNASEDGEKSLEQLTLAYEDFTEDTPATTNARDTSVD